MRQAAKQIGPIIQALTFAPSTLSDVTAHDSNVFYSLVSVVKSALILLAVIVHSSAR